MNARHDLVLHRQIEDVPQERTGLLRREQQVVPLENVHRRLAPERLQPGIGKRTPGQHEMQRAGEIGEKPPQRPGAEIASGEVLHVVEDQDHPAAQGFLRVADEDVGQSFRLVGGRPEAVPQPLAALAELGGVLLHPLDQVAEEHPRIAVRGIEPVPHRVAAEIAQEAGDETGLPVAGTGDDERGAPFQPRGEASVQPRPRQMQRTRRRRQELGPHERDGRHRGPPFFPAAASGAHDHSSIPA